LEACEGRLHARNIAQMAAFQRSRYPQSNKE
jgi:hypothetical protein